MTLDEAKAFLAECEKEELQDHAFGDAEVGWVKNNMEVASGYFGAKAHRVYIGGQTFKGKEADELREIFKKEAVTRNDETGPAEFKQGQIMPGLTIEGVQKELEKK